MSRFSIFILLAALMSFLLSGCLHDSGNNSGDKNTDSTLNRLLVRNSIEPIEDPIVNDAKAALGQALFFDKELSGNRNISCATCHTPEATTGDAISLSIGEGGVGSAEFREPPFDFHGQPILIPRNSPSLFFRGHLKTLFWDGRVQQKQDGSFISPAGEDLLPGLESSLAVVDMFPFTDRIEMRGQPGQNEIADIPDDDLQGIWTALLNRLLAIPGYVAMFTAAYPEVPTVELTFAHAANAIAAFEIKHWTLNDSPFDHYLHGDQQAMTEAQKNGAILFYGKAGCVSCHSGSLMTDESFHNRLVPQLGPGKGHGPNGLYDFGRATVTGNLEDRYKFRTFPLRSIAASGPFMHDGAFATLAATVLHCMDPMASILAYDFTQLTANYQESYHPEHTAEIIEAANEDEIEPVLLTDDEFNLLVEFLQALSSDSLDDLPELDTPDSVPSGLPVED